jgi:glycosyltransferase involved in cell wall biosynthesis
MDSPKAPVKVLWISCVGEKGGAEVYLLNFLRHLDRSRFSPAAALLRPGPLQDDLVALGVPVFALRAHRMRNPLGVLRAIGQIRRLIHSQRIHLIHSNGFRAHVYGGVAARLSGRAEVWSVHTPERASLANTLILRIPVSQVTANCPRTAAWYSAQGFPVKMIWPPVDIDRLALRTGWLELGQKYRLPANARWVGMAARLQRYKGHEFFLRALAALPAGLRDVHALIIGGTLFGVEAGYAEGLRALASELGLAERVHFTGFVPDLDLHGLISACDLVVHPALDEDFGLTVAESQALEKPVIAFASVGPAAIIEPGVTGELVPAGDQPCLDAALRNMLRLTAAERQRLGRAGRARVEQLFAAPRATRQLECLYEATLRP